MKDLGLILAAGPGAAGVCPSSLQRVGVLAGVGWSAEAFPGAKQWGLAHGKSCVHLDSRPGGKFSSHGNRMTRDTCVPALNPFFIPKPAVTPTTQEHLVKFCRWKGSAGGAGGLDPLMNGMARVLV